MSGIDLRSTYLGSLPAKELFVSGIYTESWFKKQDDYFMVTFDYF